MALWSSIEADDNGTLFIVTKNDGVPHRRPIEPGADVSGEPEIIKAAVADIWTPNVLAAWEQRKADQAKREEEAKTANEAAEAERQKAQEEQFAAMADRLGFVRKS